MTESTFAAQSHTTSAATAWSGTSLLSKTSCCLQVTGKKNDVYVRQATCPMASGCHVTTSHWVYMTRKARRPREQARSKGWKRVSGTPVNFEDLIKSDPSANAGCIATTASSRPQRALAQHVQAAGAGHRAGLSPGNPGDRLLLRRTDQLGYLHAHQPATSSRSNPVAGSDSVVVHEIGHALAAPCLWQGVDHVLRPGLQRRLLHAGRPACGHARLPHNSADFY